jgi:hypothetical protein
VTASQKRIETIYVATGTVEGQPRVFGELMIERLGGGKWRAVSINNGERQAILDCASREKAIARCRVMAEHANAQFAVHPLLSNCRFRRRDLT